MGLVKKSIAQMFYSSNYCTSSWVCQVWSPTQRIAQSVSLLWLLLEYLLVACFLISKLYSTQCQLQNASCLFLLLMHHVKYNHAVTRTKINTRKVKWLSFDTNAFFSRKQKQNEIIKRNVKKVFSTRVCF